MRKIKHINYTYKINKYQLPQSKKINKIMMIPTTNSTKAKAHNVHNNAVDSPFCHVAFFFQVKKY